MSVCSGGWLKTRECRASEGENHHVPDSDYVGFQERMAQEMAKLQDAVRTQDAIRTAVKEVEVSKPCIHDRVKPWNVP
jgi:hypothetical protein